MMVMSCPDGQHDPGEPPAADGAIRWRSRSPKAVSAHSGDALSRLPHPLSAIICRATRLKGGRAGCARQTVTSPVGDVVYLSLTSYCRIRPGGLKDIAAPPIFPPRR